MEDEAKGALQTIESREGASEFVLRVEQAVTREEQAILLVWLRGLAGIRESNSWAITKGVQAIELTVRSDATWPLVKVLASELQHYGWDSRTWAERAGLGGILAGVLAGGGAGIAALGGAIGVPLWLVLGAGGYVLADLIAKFGSTESKDPD